MAKKKLKIAFLNIYNGVINRGAETYIKEVASRLSENQSVTVFQSGDPSGKEKYKVKPIPVDCDWSRKSGVGTIAGKLFVDYWSRQIFLFSLKCFPLIVEERFDIVIPVNGGWLPALMRICTWLSGGKMVISGQSGIGWDDRNNLYCFPNTFVALSTRAANWAKRVNPLVKSVYIPNGVDVEKFKAQGKKLDINLPKPVILCVSALTPSKRVDLVIKAVAELGKASLLLVGDGDLKEKLSAIGKDLLQDRFQLIKLPFERMPEAYRSADVFTISSEAYYSFEIVLTEAMASGLPVVASDDPIRREIVGQAGILVDPQDTTAYAQALKKALKTDWGKKPGNQAKKFDWDKVAGKYEELFLELCQK